MKFNPKFIIQSFQEKAKRFEDLSNEQQTHYDKALLQWSSHLVQDFHRSSRWYLTAGTGLAILVIYSLFTGQWTFAAALTVFAGVYYYISVQETPTVEVKVSDIGVKVGKRVYPYTDLKTFWVEYNPPYFQNLHLVTRNRFKPEVSIQIHQINVSDLRTILTRYIPEWAEKQNSLTDNITQSLGL